jgi:putative SOS response-associated peptidase YedK
VCDRYAAPSEADIQRLWHIGGRSGPNSFPGLFNAAPTRVLPVIRARPHCGRQIALLRWGLIPSWAKDPRIGEQAINAPEETLIERSTFRDAFKHRRCLIPMAGFYEWQATPTGKVPYYVHLLRVEQFGVAGLYECWQGTGGAQPIESFTIITTKANALVGEIHDRMPAIIAERAQETWLDLNNENTEELCQLLKPYPPDEMHAYRISSRVNSATNDGPGLLLPQD